MKNLILALSLLISFSVFAGGGKGPESTISSWVNFIVLVVGLVLVTKNKAAAFFTTKSDSVVEMMDRAASKAKEAQYMMEVQQKKVSGVDEEIKAMKADQDKYLQDFETKYKAEVEERIAKLKEDAAQKIEAEKAELLNELNANLLDLVVANTKAKIKADPALAEVASSKIVKGL